MARECLSATEFIVLQEIFHSETAAYVDVLLPGASFAEKNGTFTNTERRVQPVRQAISPLGQAMADWQITSQLAQRMLRDTARESVGEFAGWSYSSADDILREINRANTKLRWYHSCSRPTG